LLEAVCHETTKSTVIVATAGALLGAVIGIELRCGAVRTLSS
jgi:hypothetical protein